MVRVTILDILAYRDGELVRERHESRIELVREGHVSHLKTFGGDYARLRETSLEEVSRDWCERRFGRRPPGHYEYPKVMDLMLASGGQTDLGEWVGLTNPAGIRRRRRKRKAPAPSTPESEQS